MAAVGISPSLTSLFNTSLDTGRVPIEWKSANVIPVPKSGSSEQVDNFRPVSLLPVLAKIFEKRVHRQLRNATSYIQLSLASDPSGLHKMLWYAWLTAGERLLMLTYW